MKATTYKELEKLSIEDLKRAYDVMAKETLLGLSFYREEIARREAEELNQRISAHTHQMRNMTGAVLFLTVINVILVAITLYK